MFGIYRYGLAFCVAISHLWGGMIPGPAAYAVWGFYCLSGYLMTLVLNERYGFTPHGLARFAINRSLRIFPAYYAVCLGMFALFCAVPETASRFLAELHMPHTAQGWWYTLLLFPTPDGNELIHGSMALRVELWFYVAMALGLCRCRSTVRLWFGASVLYTLWLLALRTPFPQRYVYIPGCSLAFSFGSLIYHERHWLPVIRTPRAALAAALLWWLHVGLAQHIRYGPLVFGLYSSLLFSGIALVCLMRLEPRQLPHWMRQLDFWAGNLSYPMYLCHWGIGIMASWLFHGADRNDPRVFLLGFPVVNVLSWLIYRFVEQPLQACKRPGPARADAREPSVFSLSSGSSTPIRPARHDPGTGTRAPALARQFASARESHNGPTRV